MKKQIEPGTILISKPFMEDKRFEKTVILITEHSENGSVGFILNKQLSLNIQELIANFPTKLNLKEGGPVETDSVFFIHTYPDLINNSISIKDGLFWGGDFEDIIQGFNNEEIKKNEIAFFLGYSGWEKNQLIDEIKEGSWITHGINLKNFNSKISWPALLIEINKEYEVWASAPSDFHLN